jgi:hypothetical protein
MARTLKYTVQVFWAVFGLIGGYFLAVFFWNFRFNSFDSAFVLLMILPLFLSSAAVYGAYQALCHFSVGVIAPTVVLAYLIVFFIGEHWLGPFFLQLWQGNTSRWQSALILLDATRVGLEIGLGVWCVRKTRRLIEYMLFPGLRHSAAHIF